MVAKRDPAAAQDGRDRLLRSGLHMLAATVFAQATGLARTYLAARWLGPASFGVWMGLRLVLDYGGHLHLGVLNAMHRHVPMLRGQGRGADAEALERTCFWFVVLVATGAAALTALMGALGLFGDAAAVMPPLGATLLVTLLKGYFTTEFRARDRFSAASAAGVVGSLATLASLPAIRWFGLQGFLWGMFASIAIEVVFLARLSRIPRPALDRRILLEQVRVGVPTLAVLVLTVAVSTADRSVILERLGPDALGLYGAAFIVNTVMSAVSTVPIALLYPRMSERYGATGRPADLLRMVAEPLHVTAWLFAAIATVGAVALPALIPVFLPRYAAGVGAAQVAFFAAYGQVVAGVVANVFLTLNSMRLYLLNLLVGAAVSYVAATAFVVRWPGLTAAAAGVGLGGLTYMVCCIFTAFQAMEQPRGVALRSVWQALLPLAYGALGAEAARRALGASGVTPDRPVAWVTGAALMVGLVLAPPLWRVARRVRRA